MNCKEHKWYDSGNDRVTCPYCLAEADTAVNPPHCAKHPRYSVVPFCPDCRNEEEQVRRKQQELREGIEDAALGVRLHGGDGYPPTHLMLERAAADMAAQNPLAVQEGGSHYKSLKIQPIEYIHANSIPFAEGSVIKYVTRWRDKGGLADLKKARHFLDLLIELETRGKEGIGE